MTEKHAEQQPFSIRLCNTVNRMIGGGGKRESENESKVKKKEQRQSKWFNSSSESKAFNAMRRLIWQ